MNTRNFILAALVAALLQSVALGSMIYNRAGKIVSGKEIVLQSKIRNPRDLFLGRYISLTLDVGQLRTEDIEVNGRFSYNDPVYVELQKTDDVFWTAKAIFTRKPEAATGPFIKGTITNSGTGDARGQYRIRFPFDRYFAPRQKSPELEKLGQNRKLGVILAVDDTGVGIIKGISIDGKLIFEEPLY